MRAPYATQSWRRPPRPGRAFTLIELLAVVVVIVLLAGIVLGLASYTTRRAGIGRAKADLAIIGAACEAFRGDHTRYPTSTLFRLSMTYYWEGHNSALLVDQLVGGGYATEGALPVIPTKYVPCETETNTVRALVDPWSSPYNYYCTYPRILSETWSNVTCNMLYEPNGTNGLGEYLVGGQQRPQSFDLFSYGPDKHTYNDGGVVWDTLWPAICRVRKTAADDIWQ